jgi:hypothetical protein
MAQALPHPLTAGPEVEATPVPVLSRGWSSPRTVPVESEAGAATLTLEYIRTLGRGRGAGVDLVRDVHADRLIAEKVFGFGRGLSSSITTALYWLCYQAPFAYRTTASAVWSAYYRRKALRLLSEYWFGRPCVADALYVRWDRAAQAFVLGTEYIAGRGPRVASPDPCLLQRWWGASALPPRPPQEMDELVAFMERLRAHLRDSGFIGAQWQVDRRTLVATANCLHDGHSWVVVDLESGVPALTIPRYLRQGLGIGRFPLFDDTDFTTVWSYVERHSEALAQRLGLDKRWDLQHLLKELEQHEHAWKRGEVALLREPQRWRRPADRAHIRRQTLQRWLQTGRITPETASRLERAPLRFLGHWIGGGALNRVRRWARFLGDRTYRGAAIAPYVAVWVQTGRLDAVRGARLVDDPCVWPLAVTALAAMLPVPLLRFLRDSRYRAVALTRAYRLLVDERYQLLRAEQFIRGRIDAWQSVHRLTTAEAEELRQMVATPSAQEYVRGFGVHLALKALLPSALLDPLFVGTAVATGSMYPLALMFTRSMAITVYTLARWIKHPAVGFGTALVVGLVPKLGILAYPGQLLTIHPQLASFLVRDLAARLGQRLPIYGGPHTLTEHGLIRYADLALSLGSWVMHLFRNSPRVT